MLIETHGDHLTRLTRFPRVFPINCFLVRDDDGLTLVDTGVVGGARAILAAAADAGAPIRRIALTHAHGDHVGGLDGLRKALPEAEVSISARDARFLRGDPSLDPDEPQTKPRGQFQKTKTQPTRLLHPGDRVGSLEVRHRPGHTRRPGRISSIPRSDAVSWAAAFQTLAQGAPSLLSASFAPLPLSGVRHLAQAEPPSNTVAPVAPRPDPSRLAGGHGDVLDDPLAGWSTPSQPPAARFRGERDRAPVDRVTRRRPLDRAVVAARAEWPRRRV
jgi:hypothetical protein